jgi:molybdopterin/thiamine biosynthesis adenylyltransferase/rhodanese-related sulfurtransferase
MSFSARELERYSRHLSLPGFGSEGQQALKRGSALIVGAGGLGSPAALYLAAAGVGRIGLVDFDRVERSNLQRQVLYTEEDLGESKARVAARRLQALNPDIRVEVFEQRLCAANALELLGGFDVILDGTDNFPTRYLVNDACVLLGKPNCHASIFRFDGQASVFHHRGGPCYRCVFPSPPPEGQAPSCAEGGVLGVLPGLLGTIQATEAIKLLAGIEGGLGGRLLLVDALAMEFSSLKLRRDPACPVCGERPTIRALQDIEVVCALPGPGETAPAEAPFRELDPVLFEDHRRLHPGLFLLDVREDWERELCSIPGSHWIPLAQVGSRLDELPRQGEIVIHCRSGVRSRLACDLLADAGFRNLWNLSGGILAWATVHDPGMPRY